jgi:hypothetical protein
MDGLPNAVQAKDEVAREAVTHRCVLIGVAARSLEL